MWLVDDTSFACCRPVMKIVGLSVGQLRHRDQLAGGRQRDLQHRDVAAAIRHARLVGLDFGIRGQLPDDALAIRPG